MSKYEKKKMGRHKKREKANGNKIRKLYLACENDGRFFLPCGVGDSVDDLSELMSIASSRILSVLDTRESVDNMLFITVDMCE